MEPVVNKLQEGVKYPRFERDATKTINDLVTEYNAIMRENISDSDKGFQVDACIEKLIAEINKKNSFNAVFQSTMQIYKI